jgi:sensor histidine kinase regulating citrate/malate metabolism
LTSKIVVEDDGPGLSEQDERTLQAGEETDLQHGSGICLWLVAWSTGAAEGEMFFEETGNGSRFTLWFPSLAGSG